MRCRSLVRAFSTPPVIRACSIRQFLHQKRKDRASHALKSAVLSPATAASSVCQPKRLSGLAIRAILVNQIFWRHAARTCKQATKHPDSYRKLSKMRFCGPKSSTCMFLLSVWGTIMLLILGVCFQTQSVILYKDVDYEQTAWQNVAISCYISGGMYAVIGVISYWQKVVNDRYLALEPETTSIMF
eukprot:sb/3471363/